MTIGIIGLGLIGGSLAKTFKKQDFTLLGYDIDPSITSFAKMAGAIDRPLDDESLPCCDVVFLAVNPRPATRWIEENSHKLSPSTLLIDCCGTKQRVCDAGFKAAKTFGFTFAGGHPMAGREVGGFKNSREDLFSGATFIAVVSNHNDLDLMTRLKSFLTLAGFGHIAFTTAKEHDRLIAYTSQMTHLIANAFVQSDSATIRGKAAFGGSFRDFTRVAFLDENLWTELFLENKQPLLTELNGFISHLTRYRDALEKEDEQTLKALLLEGKNRKKEVEEK